MQPSEITVIEHEAVELLHDALLAHPPTARRFTPPDQRMPLPLGGYLLVLGYATPRQIVTTLSVQHGVQRQRLMFGDLLVAHKVLHPQVLAAVLAIQLVDRLHVAEPIAPRFLGEYLVAQRLLSLRQLAGVLELQATLRQQGFWVPLGELLVQQGCITHQALQRVLNLQKQHGS